MRLPAGLQQAINDQLSHLDPPALARASAQLTERYKAGDYARIPLDNPAARLAYLRVRMPATFAANVHVFHQTATRFPASDIRSMLDLGAGPGTSMWAAAEAFPAIQRFTLFERDEQLAEIGRGLAWHSTNDAVRSSVWQQRDLNSLADLDTHHLVVLSYVLGELPVAAAEKLIRIAWATTGKLFVVIEPGTPKNFQRLSFARSMLIGLGAHPVAPCPHANTCPLDVVGDWCHFAQRLERTSDHRIAKSGTLGYEDEKFSYFVAAKAPVPLPCGRIVRHPLKHKGHVQLTLCTPTGVDRPTLARSQKELYKAARKAEWGDPWLSSDGNVNL